MENETNVTNTSVETEQTQTTEVKTYTAEEVASLLQSEADKRVSAALKKQQAKYERQIANLNSLSELDGDKRTIAQKEQELEDLRAQLAEFQVEKSKSEFKSVLAARGLSVQFADMLKITEDAEQNQVLIDTLDKLYKADVKAEVERRLAGNTPKGNGSTVSAEPTSLKGLTLAQISEIQKSNPELLDKLKNK